MPSPVPPVPGFGAGGMQCTAPKLPWCPGVHVGLGEGVLLSHGGHPRVSAGHIILLSMPNITARTCWARRERVLVVTGWAPKSKRWLHQRSVDLVCAVSFGPSSPGVCACWLISCGFALLIVLVGLFCAGGFAMCRLVCFIASCSIWCLMTRLGIVLWCLTCFGAGWLVLRVTCAKKAFLGGWRVVGEGQGGRPSCCSNTRHLHGMFE